MKTTMETARKQQKLLLPGALDFQHPCRVRVSAGCPASSTPEFGHRGFENSTNFNNRYGKWQLVGAVISNEHSEREISRSAAIKLIAYTREIYSQILYFSIGLMKSLSLSSPCGRNDGYYWADNVRAIVRKRHRGWGYVNILKHFGAQTQSGRGTTPAPLLEKRRGKWLKNGWKWWFY